VHRILDRPSELVLDDAVAYWLEEASGRHLGPEAERSLRPMFLALKMARAGRDPDGLVLCARLEDGERFEIGRGPGLISVAEVAAGLPRPPRPRGRGCADDGRETLVSGPAPAH
jgi:hypothetical protein